jgi:hypothetical protein
MTIALFDEECQSFPKEFFRVSFSFKDEWAFKITDLLTF